MRNGHIFGHPAPPSKVAPFAQQLDDTVRLSAPDETVWAARRFLTHRGLIKLSLYWLADKPKRFELHGSQLTG
jgi:hypothetical protein